MARTTKKRRGKTPRPRRERAENLPELLNNVRQARRNVLIAEGHLLAHRKAENEAVMAAWSAGATHDELWAATAKPGERARGSLHPALRRVRGRR